MCLRFLWLHRGIYYSQVFAIPIVSYIWVHAYSRKECTGMHWVYLDMSMCFGRDFLNMLQVLRLWRLSTRILQATEHTYAPWYGPANLVTWNAPISSFPWGHPRSKWTHDTCICFCWINCYGSERFHNVVPSFQTSGSLLLVFGQPHPRTCNQCQPGSVACHLSGHPAEHVWEFLV